jgi:nuclear pore complex protein Nup188
MQLLVAVFEQQCSTRPDIAATEIINPVSRPFFAKLVHRWFYNLTSNIVYTLISFSSAEDTLPARQPLPNLALRASRTRECPPSPNLPAPPNPLCSCQHSKAVLEEPASMGTLIELASGTLDSTPSATSSRARRTSANAKRPNAAL